MLVMVDPHVHFHVIPRYAAERRYGGIVFFDNAWPGAPDLARNNSMNEKEFSRLADNLRSAWAESRKFLKKMLEVFLRLCKISPFEIMQRYTMAVIYVYNRVEERERMNTLCLRKDTIIQITSLPLSTGVKKNETGV